MMELSKKVADYVDEFYFKGLEPYGITSPELSKKIADDVDEFYFKVLEPYGITRENFREYKDRLHMNVYPDHHDILLDGEHILTYMVHIDRSNIYEENGVYKVTLKAWYEVIWEKGKVVDD